MKAVVIGPGRIGAGFTGQLMRASGFDVVFAARNAELVDHLNRVGSYDVRLVGGGSEETVTVDGVRAVRTTDVAAVAREIADADVVATAVTATALPDVAPLIAAGLAERRAPVNVIAFENLAGAGEALREMVRRHLPAGSAVEAHGFSGAMVGRAVARRAGDPAGDEPLTFVGDRPETFAVDATGLRAPIPAIHGMVVVDDYAAWVHRKLYTFLAGHAATAYLGALKGYRYIHSAIRDGEIRAAVIGAIAEGQAGLAARYGAAFAGDATDIEAIVGRFENAALNDVVHRVARDPRRKLAREDRIVGAGRMAEQAGVAPSMLALTAAAALLFDAPSPAEPVADTVRHVCGVDAGSGFGAEIVEAYRALSGRSSGTVVASLTHRRWAHRLQAQIAGEGAA